jgi:membrane glycosyltransferase
MIVLDADSLMAGETLVEMVYRMERDPGIGILQAPTQPVNRQSLFARTQQFAAYLYGPIFLDGFVHWSECDGNYYGHNAIIRIRPFMEHCELPILPGDGPLGGEILSHDFVEAALMRRAGWKVCIAHDLEGSYEECPATLVDYARRDQRWCQGNLQHMRLLLAEGLHPASRLHFGMGAMSFLASPLWLAFLMLTMIGAIYGSTLPATAWPGGLILFGLTMSFLLLPKAWAAIAMTRHTQRCPSGSESRVLASVLIETFASMLTAPIMMLLHTRFVISILLGVKVTWTAQRRDDCGVPLREAFRTHYPHTLAGVVLGGIAWLWAPDLLPWLMPVLAGLVLSIPLAMVLGSVKIGKWLADRGLLTIPEEVAPPRVLQYQHDALTVNNSEMETSSDVKSPEMETGVDPGDIFGWVLRDPAFYALHVGILRATDSSVPISPAQFQQIQDLIHQDAQAVAPADVRLAVLSDWRALEALHIRKRSDPPARSILLK